MFSVSGRASGPGGTTGPSVGNRVPPQSDPASMGVRGGTRLRAVPYRAGWIIVTCQLNSAQDAVYTPAPYRVEPPGGPNPMS